MVILGLYWVEIGFILGLYWGLGLYWVSIGLILVLYWGYIGIMEKKMETTLVTGLAFTKVIYDSQH